MAKNYNLCRFYVLLQKLEKLAEICFVTVAIKITITILFLQNKIFLALLRRIYYFT